MAKLKLPALFLFIFLLYILFPTRNSTQDAYYYAGCIKYREDLFLPHHLLYNWLGFVLHNFVTSLGVNIAVLPFMKMINALFAVICIWIFYMILKKTGRRTGEIMPLLLLAGLSFGVWRFATENENYIIPIGFSLAASLLLLYYFESWQNYQLIFSGLLAAIACLFHQIHFFWWLGLLIGVTFYFRSIKSFLLFGLPAFVVPLVYAMAIKFFYHYPLTIDGIRHFTFHDFYAGTFNNSISIQTFILSAINFIRTFFQIHGIQLVLLKYSFIYYIPLLAVFGGLILLFSGKNLFQKKESNIYKPFITIHILIFLLQFLFASYWVGNAEFMVMLPFLLFMILPAFFEIRASALWISTGVLLCWNFMYGIYPNFKYDYFNSSYIISKVTEDNSAYYILKDKPLIENRIYYEYGIPEIKNASIAPWEKATLNISLVKFADTIKLMLSEGKNVYTNCIGGPKIMNRASIVAASEDEKFFSQYKLAKVDSFESFYGLNYFLKVK